MLRSSLTRRVARNSRAALDQSRVVEAGTPQADAYQRSEMKLTRWMNLSAYGVVLVALAGLGVFYRTQGGALWTNYKDPYEFPTGFNPNQDPPPTDALPKSSATGSMMSASAPGSFSVKRAKDANANR